MSAVLIILTGAFLVWGLVFNFQLPRHYRRKMRTRALVFAVQPGRKRHRHHGRRQSR